MVMVKAQLTHHVMVVVTALLHAVVEMLLCDCWRMSKGLSVGIAQGYGGVLAAGFYDNHWRLSQGGLSFSQAMCSTP